MAPTILFVPIAWAPGSSTIDKVGSEINPPPPTIESMSPVKKPSAVNR